ncbi:(6-4)DNA photolyase [Gracilariopsis chorda]|uniref:(6-4)DNA photolyase n=1 Tax=Gracilariopsis chorda TaxID=448386 RepID=A0A2V3IW64_9FLOR|nr:(6-4)DNA photolyase [Gracilariopsis chorda]|eukprot:PXF46329.1 (6-4)DNA photolyase [Gracilariopsis chorda]
MPSPAVLHWFRRDLRLTDNRALNEAIRVAKKTKSPLIPLYILDPNLIPQNCSAVRMRFLRESVSQLRSSLLKHGLNLRVVRGQATQVIPDLAGRWRVRDTFWESEYDPVSRERDAQVARDLKGSGVNVRTFPGFLLYDPDDVLRHCNGLAPRTMTGMLKLVEILGDPRTPDSFANGELVEFEEDPFLYEDRAQGMCDIPSLADLGYQDPENRWDVFEGGEKAGLKRLHRFVKQKNGRIVADFAKPKTNPAAFSHRETTVLSPYLALGCVSCRVFHERLREVEQRYALQEMPQTTLWGQLIWREHFWLLAYSVKNFHQMRGNVVCRQINWRADKQSEELLRTWAEARTGFPWIDALMTQLHKEGFIHHLGRHSLACFLTRGDLWISWERGFKVFEKYLIDYDYALNSANWMWLSCSAFFVMYYRVYSPVTYGKKWDKDGNFIRHYLPVLRTMPSKYIYEPWKAPKELQRRVGCIIGKDYPEPIVDHRTASQCNIARMKESFEKGEFGKLEDETESRVIASANNSIITSDDVREPYRKRRRR